MPINLIRNQEIHPFMTEADVERDMDLVREILLYVEKNGNPGVNLYEHIFEIDGEKIGKDLIWSYVELLTKGNFIESNVASNLCYVKSISWNGYDLLDNIRPTERWEVIKKAVLEGGTFSLQILWDRAYATASEQISNILKKLMNIEN